MTTRRFLAVGLNHFAAPGNDLSCCIADCHTMESVALALGITADALTDQAATKQNVESWLLDAQKQAIAGKLTYLGYSHSGHGTHFTVNGVLEAAIVYYNLTELNGDWNPTGLMAASRFQEIMNGFPLSCRVSVFLDTCFSFGETRAFDTKVKAIHNPGNSSGLFRVTDPPGQIHAKLNPNIVVWCSSSADQESADAPNLGNGAGTYAWVNAWKKNPKASRLDLIVAQRALIKSLGFDQVPRLACWNQVAQLPVGA